mmetsp:Transcript_4045/g.11732  ORF Transcript_4045/g.11732 Transcript_4045/m.11732 type:complete len:92 (-) Transcript_4045:538-813(-)
MRPGASASPAAARTTVDPATTNFVAAAAGADVVRAAAGAGPRPQDRTGILFGVAGSCVPPIPQPAHDSAHPSAAAAAAAFTAAGRAPCSPT